MFDVGSHGLLMRDDYVEMTLQALLEVLELDRSTRLEKDSSLFRLQLPHCRPALPTYQIGSPIPLLSFLSDVGELWRSGARRQGALPKVSSKERSSVPLTREHTVRQGSRLFSSIKSHNELQLGKVTGYLH